MAYPGLSTMVKTGIATVVAGGVLVAGIAWQGEGSMNNIKDNVDSLKNKCIQAIEDNEWLQDQFISLKMLYNYAVDEANGTIEELNYIKQQLEAQVVNLTDELQAKEVQLQELKNKNLATEQELQVAQGKLQSEIDRLEAELDKANRQIAELETFVAEANNVEYTAIDRDAFTVIEREILEADTTGSASIFVSPEAITLNRTQALLMESKASAMETVLGVDIVGVVVASNGQLAYKVNSISGTVLNNMNTMATNEILNVKNSITPNSLFFVDNSGLIRYIKNNGQYRA